MKKITVIFIILTVLLHGVGMAQGQVEIDVAPRRLTTDEAVTVTVTVSGRIVSVPELPLLDQFSLIGQRQVNQTSIVNGVVNQSVQFVYTLRPVETGTLTVGAFVVEVDGVRVETEPQTVEVGQGAQELLYINISEFDGILPDGVSRDDDFFMATGVDSDVPWLGEEVVYTFWLFIATDLVGIDSIEFSAPEFEGFWNDDLFQNPRNRTIMDGRDYLISQYDWYVYPTVPGRQTIGSPTVYVTTDSFLFAFDEPIKVFGEDVEVDIRPLPDGAPEAFTGAVGDFVIERTIDTNFVAMNDDVTMDVTVQGIGNFGALPKPLWPNLEKWRVIDKETNTARELTAEGVRGEQSWTQALIPTEPGQWEIPALTYSYFNPETAQYETARAESFVVDVTGQAVPGEVAAAVNDERPSIRPNRGTPELLEQPERLLQDRWSYWALWLVPLVIVLGAEVVLGLRKRPKKMRRVDDFSSQSERLDRALYERFGVQVGGMTHVERREALDELIVDDGVIDEIDAFYRENEMKHFIGSGEIDAQRVIDLIGGGNE